MPKKKRPNITKKSQLNAKANRKREKRKLHSIEENNALLLIQPNDDSTNKKKVKLTKVELKENVCNCYTVATTSTFICPHQTRPVNTENVVGMHTVPIRFRNVDNDMDQNPNPPILKSKQHEFAGDLSKLLPIKVAKHSLGKMFSKCSYCGALRFASAKGRSVNSCCHNDNIHIPPLHEYPLFLKNLLLSDEQEAKLFRQNIRVYNSSFAFATFSAKFLQDESRGPPLIKIQGQVYHHATTSLNSATNAPRNGQIYIYDSVEEAIKLRMNLDNLQLTRHIEKLLREVNPYAQKYRMLRDLTIHDSEFVLQFQRFIFDDKRRYNKPTSSELAAIIVSKDGVVPVCDLTVYPKQEIRETSIINQRSQHADPMVFPLLFPKGDLGWTYQMPSQKGKQISPIQYYGHRLALRPNGPFNPLLHAGKLSQQYVINCYLLVESQRLDFIRNNQGTLRTECYQGLIDHVERNSLNETDRVRLGTAVILPATYIGSPRSMQQLYQDAIAICRKVGRPDFFITMTCNPQWPEITETLKDHFIKGTTVNDISIIVTKIFQAKVDELIEGTVVNEKK
ncbi:uncharacterized protein [Parasteatoda tepidariorum]|uniref:uncharacterized protein n=1 Tax=Parasteatoda tepidariorum TaxID=114398 RepID=UPI0039BD710A